ncbi:MAG TPA: helix-turn-helix domain-containing protein [Candidatus Bathyarchaeia archaeon]|nr:helix-turn-helix domain-containing protein [Candidatus Bathyarchaeia archaeon]
MRRHALPETAAMCLQQYRTTIPTADDLRSNGEAYDCRADEVQALIGANLKRLRRQRGLSRRRLARLAELEGSTLRMLERGAMTPGIGMLWKLARELHVPCTAFIEAATAPSAMSSRMDGSGLLALG